MKFYVVTFGCSFNKHDSELIIDILRNKFEYSSIEEADVVVINTCTVKNLAETKAFKLLRKLRQKGKKVVFCGCIPQAEPTLLENKLKNVCVIGPYAISNIESAVEAAIKGEIYHNISKEALNRLRCDFSFSNVTKIIPISDGCLGNCSYCKTRFARGRLRSFPIYEIVNSIREAVQRGYKEIFLTSQDVACYGKDIGVSLVDLMKAITNIEGSFFVRIGMGNPAFFKECFPEFLELLKNPVFYKFIHLPVQSGSDKILKMMNRRYRRKDYLDLVKMTRKAIPKSSISTDMIVAFPGETIEDFKDSLELIRKTEPDVLNISRFWLRPGTEAERYKNLMIDGKESKRRSKVLKEFFNEISTKKNEKWLRWRGKALITEKGKKGTYIARNEYYKQIVLQGKFSVGDWVKVEIVGSSPFDLKGVVIDKLNE